MPPARVTQLNAVLNYLSVGWWMKEHGFVIPARVESREKVFELVAAQVGGSCVLYLEFGVFEGAATLYWSKQLVNPATRLHGFDSFEGLPESWNGTTRDVGHFSTNGQVPQLNDPRVKFFKGWFEQTLPTYQAPEHDVLVVNLDADLYSSTAYVLKQIHNLLKPGTYIYFDEFNHRDHELKAFTEFLKETGLKCSLFAASSTLEHVAFKLL